jgi:predicted Zn-ribbon and HTH transcriptional regulator
MRIRIKELKCKRCNWKWTPRKTEIRQCPHCKSTYWNEEKPAILTYETSE